MDRNRGGCKDGKHRLRSEPRPTRKFTTLFFLLFSESPCLCGKKCGFADSQLWSPPVPCFVLRHSSFCPLPYDTPRSVPGLKAVEHVLAELAGGAVGGDAATHLGHLFDKVHQAEVEVVFNERKC